MIRIDLGFHLCAVASVDKDTGNIPQHHAEPGGPGEPGQPRQPRVAIGHIFPLMSIRAGHDEPVQTAIQSLAQGGEARRTLLGPCSYVERLKQGNLLLLGTRLFRQLVAMFGKSPALKRSGLRPESR